jgi:hypothetical protein
MLRGGGGMKNVAFVVGCSRSLGLRVGFSVFLDVFYPKLQT